MALRNDFAPQVIAYWLMSRAMASCAADLISAGAGKSGNPCARLTALCAMASRVISRITDSVKRDAFSLKIPRAACASAFCICELEEGTGAGVVTTTLERPSGGAGASALAAEHIRADADRRPPHLPTSSRPA